MSRLIEALEKAGDGPRGLRRARLHICTYHALCLVIKTIVDEKRPAYTIEQEVADWCRKQPELIVREIGTGWWEILQKGASYADECTDWVQIRG